MKGIFKMKESGKIYLNYKKGSGKYKTVDTFKTGYDVADFLKENNLVSDEMITYIRQNAFMLCIKGAQCSVAALDGGRYQIKNSVPLEINK